MPNGITQASVALNLDDDACPPFSDGKLRIISEDGMVTFFVQNKDSGLDFIRAECSIEDFNKALTIIGVCR